MGLLCCLTYVISVENFYPFTEGVEGYYCYQYNGANPDNCPVYGAEQEGGQE